MPKISVIIPTHNRPLLLRSAIQSVLSQTFQDFEIIVVDDASNGSTQELLGSFSDKRIKYIQHDYNKGEAASRNTGIANANGKFLAFLDDDDEWLPEKLALQVDLLEKASSRVGAVYAGVLFIDVRDSKVLSQSIPTKRGNILKDMLINNVVGTPSKVIIRRFCIEKVGLFDENLTYYVDYDFFLRFAMYFDFDYIPKPLVKYHIHENNLTNNIFIIETALDMLRKKYYFYYNSTQYHRTFYSNVYLKLGVRYCILGYPNKCRNLLRKAIKNNPYNWRPYFNIMISFLGKNLFIFITNIKNRIGLYLSDHNFIK